MPQQPELSSMTLEDYLNLYAGQQIVKIEERAEQNCAQLRADAAAVKAELIQQAAAMTEGRAA
jgi:hypothetical protein